ncbi:MAG: glycosyltransferase [Deltaproteobacteria bacterium]|nr:glycosyltransferase [Deltaproteobacteria bacterium]
MSGPRDILLVYDRAYWVLGQHAAFLEGALRARGWIVSSAPWKEVVRRPPCEQTELVPLCVGIARHLLEAGLPVRRSAVVSEAYWGEGGGSDPAFVAAVLERLERLAVINEPYLRRVEALVGEGTSVRRLHQFVDTERFAPGAPPLAPTLKERWGDRGRGGLRVGWCGDAKKAAKRVEWVRALRADPTLGQLRWRLATKRRQLGRFVPNEAMPRYYAGLDLLLCTSENEGNPMPPLEALACGVPVITTPVGVMPEVIEEGVNGFLVASLEAMGEKVRQLAADPEMLATLAKNARPSLMASPFAPERAVESWVEALLG